MFTSCAARSAPDRALSCSSDNTLKVWCLESGTVLFSFGSGKDGHLDWILGCSVIPAGALGPQEPPFVMSSSRDNTLKLWGLKEEPVLRTDQADLDANERLPILTLTHHRDWVNSVHVFEREGDGTDGSAHASSVWQALSCCDDNNLCVWDISAALQVARERAQMATEFRRVTSAVKGSVDSALHPFDADDTLQRMRSASLDTRSFRTEQEFSLQFCLATLVGHTDAIIGCCTFADPRGTSNKHKLAMSCSADTTLRIWDLATKEAILVLDNCCRARGCAAFTDSQAPLTAVACGADRLLRVWNLADLLNDKTPPLPQAEPVLSQESLKQLVLACADGNVSNVRKLFEKDGTRLVNDKYTERQGQQDREAHHQYPISMAAAHGHRAVVRELLSAGADADVPCYKGRTPLFFACEQGHTACVQLLLAHGADVNKTGQIGDTPLTWAAEHSHAMVVKLLLLANANVLHADNGRRTALIWAASRRSYDTVWKLLNVRSQDDDWILDFINWIAEDGMTALSTAAASGSVEVLTALMGRLLRTSLSTETKEGWLRGPTRPAQQGQDINPHTALEWAAREGQIDAVDLLLRVGASDLQGKRAENALALAHRHKNYACVEIIQHCLKNVTQHSIDATRKLITYDPGIRLFSVLQSKSLQEVQAWLQLPGPLRGDVNATIGDTGYTPFLWACEQGCLDIVEELIAAGCDTSMRSRLGLTGWGCTRLLARQSRSTCSTGPDDSAHHKIDQLLSKLASGRLDINKASVEQFRQLVGDDAAKKIVEHRQSRVNRKFEGVDDLYEVALQILEPTTASHIVQRLRTEVVCAPEDPPHLVLRMEQKGASWFCHACEF